MAINIAWWLNSLYFLTSFLVAMAFLIKGQFNQITNSATTMLFYLGIVLLEHYTKFKLKNFIRVLLIFTIIIHRLVGELLRAYYTSANFDNALHLFGSFSFALFSYQLLITFIRVQSSHPKILTVLLVSLLGIGIGTFFELLEFSLDQLLNQKNQLGLIDTDLDLLFDVLGSMLAGIFLINTEKV